jgi:hypothetical protein
VGTLEEFRNQFWSALRRPKTRTERFGRVRDDLELVSDAIAGPLFAIFEKGECDYVFSDPVTFPTIHDPETFLKWCLSLADDYRQGALKVSPANEMEKADQERLLGVATGMDRLSRMAFEIVKQRWILSNRK